MTTKEDKSRRLYIAHPAILLLARANSSIHPFFGLNMYGREKKKDALIIQTTVKNFSEFAVYLDLALRFTRVSDESLK